MRSWRSLLLSSLSVLFVAAPRPAAAQATMQVLPYRAPTPLLGPVVSPVADPYAAPPPTTPYVAPEPVDEPSPPAPRRRGHFPTGWLMPVGLTLGGAFHDAGKAGVIGGEISAVKLPEKGPFWSGGYVDMVYDRGTSAVRTSVGPEVGFLLLGVDAGPYAQFTETTTSWGFYGRAFLVLGPVIPYARMAWSASPGEQRFHELGVLLKVPVTGWDG